MSNENQELIDRCNKMSYCIGFIWGGLNTLVDDETVPNYQKEKIRVLLGIVHETIEDIFYKKSKNE